MTHFNGDLISEKGPGITFYKFLKNTKGQIIRPKDIS